MFKPRTLTLSAIAVASLALAACSSDSEGDSSSSSTAAAPSSAASAAASSTGAASSESGVTFEDGVIRAMAEDSDMTAIFGTLHNASDKEVTVTGFTSSIEADMYQVHEVVDGVMQEKKDGFKIPAGESLELAPGGYHFMLMGVHKPIMAGETATVTLLLSDGSSAELGDIPVRNIGAGDENYGDMNHDMSGMNHDMHGMHHDMSGMDHSMSEGAAAPSSAAKHAH